MAKKTIGDYWRSCTNEQLATNLVDFIISILVHAGIDEKEIDIATEYRIILDFFNTEYEELPEESSVNGYSYIN